MVPIRVPPPGEFFRSCSPKGCALCWCDPRWLVLLLLLFAGISLFPSVAPGNARRKPPCRLCRRGMDSAWRPSLGASSFVATLRYMMHEKQDGEEGVLWLQMSVSYPPLSSTQKAQMSVYYRCSTTLTSSFTFRGGLPWCADERTHNRLRIV